MGLFNKKRKLSKNNSIDLIVKNKPSSVIAEQFRTIQTNINFANANNNLRSFMVTSSSQSEGKSTIAYNLALTCAKQGKKVILVDADLRRPMAHKAFQLDNNKGMSTYLSGISDIEDSLQYTDVDNLLVMSSGPIPPNPSELLNNNKLDRLTEKLYQSSDLVIIDTPPVNLVSDASILSTKFDGVVMVIPQNISEKVSVIKAVNQLKKVHANLLGAIMNNVTDNESGEYYYTDK